ncbi:ABC transporter permease [Pedobacter caeni]|uniref:ABC-type transport system, involved in lipoprotein release, permease component n=1 Tax=Pedobacter caeni TaxID=288992 RepID=A0A1M5ALW9_9SPHI|nr:ABC transporter permease [Pedobacter caeni]SHF31156.1 ABC-type transport system, involved in lipoprotein release, permease component [Pedobacter caeni]
MFRLNFKIALRNLWKNKGYTLINVGGLAIGLASCMILLLYVGYKWSYDKQFSNYEKTYVVYNNAFTSAKLETWIWTPGLMAREIKEKVPGIAYASRSTFPEQRLISHGQQRFKSAAIFADAAFLKILDFKMIRGNRDKVLQELNSVVLTEGMAKRLFGMEDPINKMVKFENTEVLKVEAVIADVPGNSSVQFDYLLPWALLEKQNQIIRNSNWGMNFCLTLVQLKDNRFFGSVNQQLKGIYKRNEQGSNSEAFMHPLSKWHLYSTFENGVSVGGKIDQIRIFFILAFCILLIACVNFMNLSTARSEKRAKEVGVRKAIGSSRKSLISQFMLESVLLSFLGMLVAFVLMEISLPYFNGLLHTTLVIEYQNWKFWSVLLSLTFFTGFIAGSYPAFYLSSFEPVKVLKGFNIAVNSSLSVRKVLVVFQFVFAACLMVCTAVIYQQLNYIKDKPVGYNKAGLMEVPLQGVLLKDPAKMQLLKERLLKTGAVTEVTFFSKGMNEEGDATFGVEWAGKKPKEDVLFNYRSSGYDFVKTIGTSVLAGREFSAQFNDSAKVLINEAAVKLMGFRQPIGASLKLWGKSFTIIGVIKDFVMASPYQRAAPMVVYYDMGIMTSAVARLNPAQNVSSSVQKIDEVFKSFNPDFPVDRKFVDEVFKQKFDDEQLLGTLANWFGGFAIFISCLGLLGLALFTAEQRKKEIGIRKVLGASTANILALLNKDFIKLVLIANLIACPLAYVVVYKWLSAYEFRVSISVLPFAIAIFLSLIIALITVTAQSVRVVKSNPVDALKYE